MHQAKFELSLKGGSCLQDFVFFAKCLWKLEVVCNKVEGVCAKVVCKEFEVVCKVFEVVCKEFEVVCKVFEVVCKEFEVVCKKEGLGKFICEERLRIKWSQSGKQNSICPGLGVSVDARCTWLPLVAWFVLRTNLGMLQRVLAPFRRVLETPFKRILKYALKSSLGRYLHKDIKFEQFCVSITSGRAELSDVEIDTEAVHKDFGYLLNGLPFVIKRIVVKHVLVEAFGGDKDGLYVEIDGIEIELEPAGEPQAGDIMVQEETYNEMAPLSDSGDELSAGEIDRAANEEDLSQAAQDGLETLGGWIEEYAASIQVCAINMVVYVVSDQADGGKIVVKVPSISFSDTTENPVGAGVRYKSIDLSEIVISLETMTGIREQFAQISARSNAMLTFVQDACTNVRLTIPWYHVRLYPRTYQFILGILSQFGGDASIAESYADTAYGEEEPEEVQSARGGSDEGDSDFFDADDGLSSDNDNVNDANAGSVHIKESFPSGVKQQTKIQIEILRSQFELVYANNDLANDNDVEQDGWKQVDPMSVHLYNWLRIPERDMTLNLYDMFEALPSESLQQCGDRLVIRMMGTAFRAQVAINAVASFSMGHFCAVEILNESPIPQNDSTGLIHVVMEMESTSSQACCMNFVRKESLVVELAPLLISWDNAMAERMVNYLPEDDKNDPTPRKGTISKDQADDFKIDVLSSKAIVVIRVPRSFQDKSWWKREALLLDMTNVDAKTGQHHSSSFSPHGGEFYANVENLRKFVWSTVVDFEYARACIAPVSQGILKWGLAENQLWALTIGASANASAREVVLPRLSMCFRKPIGLPSQIEKVLRDSLRIAKQCRRAFKNRVHQRECQDSSDPAGDHGLEKDREPPVHTILETVLTHGFATADSSVRLCCPSATMKLDRVQYHSMNAMLQLIVGTIPSFTRPAQQKLAEDQTTPNSPDGDFAEVPSFWTLDKVGVIPDLGEDEQIAGVVSPRKAATFFFQMESNEGRVEIIDKEDTEYLFDYYGLQISLVDAKTLIESLDVTLCELSIQNDPPTQIPRPVFYSTKWGRNINSPPLVQLYIDSMASTDLDTTVMSMCVENMTLRYDPRSTWFFDLVQFLGSSPPPGAILLCDDTVTPTKSVDKDNTRNVVYTEFTVEFFDCLVEYRPVCLDESTLERSGLFLAVGLLRMSSNIATPAVTDQSYHLTARDISLYITNDPPEYSIRDHMCTSMETSSREQWTVYSSLDDYAGCMLYAKTASLNILELFIRVRFDADESSECQLEAPMYDFEVSVPNLALYTCMDSLGTLADICATMAAELSSQAATNPGDTRETPKPTINEMRTGAHMNTMIPDKQPDDEVCSSPPASQEEEDTSLQVDQNTDPQRSIVNSNDSKCSSAASCTSSDDEASLVPDVDAPDDTKTASELRKQMEKDFEDMCNTPDDQKSASQLRASYLDSVIPDDQLSGPQLRSRHQAHGMLDDAHGVCVEDGFYAVEEDTHANVESLGKYEKGEASGTWFNIDDNLQPSPKAELVDLRQYPGFGTIDAGNEDAGEETLKPGLLIWGDEDTEEIELEELNYSAQAGQSKYDSDTETTADEDIGEMQVREDSLRSRDECARARREFDSLCRKEFPAVDSIQEIVVASPKNNVSTEPSSEPTARWFSQSDVRIYPHYMGIPYEAGPGSHVPPPEALAARMDDSDRHSFRKRRGHSRFVLRDLTLQWYLFGGCDWNVTAVALEQQGTSISQDPQKSEPAFSSRHSKQKSPESRGPPRRTRHKGARRQNDKSIEIILSHASALVDCADTASGPLEENEIIQSAAIAVRDFWVTDHIQSSEINQMICEWVSERQHPRITGSSMVRLAFDRVENGRLPCKYLVRAALLPLKANIDQDALEFLLEFLSIPTEPEGKGVVDEEPETDDDDIVIVEHSQWNFHSVDIRSCKIRVDYRPKRVDLSGLVDGDRLALVNLFAYEGLEVALRRIELRDIRCWNELTHRIQQSWSTDIARQRHKCLAGVSFPPINTMASLGSGLTDLVMIPLDQYQKDGRIVHGVRRGTASFVRTVAIQALGTFSKAAMTAQTLLEHARDVLSPLPSGTEMRQQQQLYPLSSSGLQQRPTASGMSLGTESTESSARNALISQPKDIHEGLERGADSFTREVKRAAYVLVALPYNELQHTGPTAAVKSVLRGVPIAVIRPLIGATEAMSATLLGLRNSVDPDGHV
eukprot:CAMPEP_0203749328 /NCGR_PEP_ID=MMETSP0098-20131031/3938_1 /ASSEMBLY_ACC=CAM_ASM_000208 /TAXON_ID=96639 /ORGANISM=" , Strain NY0313808BC1" /LENGTH=2196 /DNA_ID=CAMNT_0050638365 /DNA_START=579 /DNA_END=7166 /DNA_ORIENTATION=-